MKIRIITSLFIALLYASSAFAQDSTSVKVKFWYIPDYATVQFAGNIGFFSVGIGYQLFNDHLYSELLYGHVPPSISKTEHIHKISLKNTFPLYTKKFSTFSLSPIAGLTLSYETENHSFVVLPDKYPKGYYHPNAFHFTLFVGAKVHKDFTNQQIIKGADFYFELGTIERYLWYAVTQKEVKLNDIFSSAVGINLYF